MYTSLKLNLPSKIRYHLVEKIKGLNPPGIGSNRLSRWYSTLNFCLFSSKSYVQNKIKNYVKQVNAKIKFL